MEKDKEYNWNSDTNKPLRIIGIQIFEGTHENVRKVLEPGWYPFIRCKNSSSIKTNKNIYPIVDDNGCPLDYFCIDKKRLPKVSISAIAGKNGSGKSSLVEILYMILNNFAEELLSTKENVKKNEVAHVYGLEARLFFELDGKQKFINLDDGPTTYFEIVDGMAKAIKIKQLTDKQRQDVLKGFFYTICVNYSLYAFNPSDYKCAFRNTSHQTDDGDWLNHLFHKNDGYYIPLVLTPFRDNGQIDTNNENELAKQRIEVLSLLFHSQKKEFLDDYVPSSFNFKFDRRYWDKKSKKLRNKPICSELSEVQDIIIFNLTDIWRNLLMAKLKRTFDPVNSDRDKIAMYYLAYKTLKICVTYPEYREMSNMDSLLDPKNQEGTATNNDKDHQEITVDPNEAGFWFNDNYDNFCKVTDALYESECTHVTLKIHQCLDYLRELRYTEDAGILDVDNDLLKGRTFETYDEMMRLLPPPFFITEVAYKKYAKKKVLSETEVTLQSMSSGERQMLYSMSYIFYHIKNIASIKAKGKRVVGYHHINLIFDEAELYYHPEYQRQYIIRLLEHLAMCNINRTNIRSINIIIITHSPFILSDLPETNILFLRKGDEKSEDLPLRTLGANIYDLLKSGFFLDYAIGDLAQKKLHEIMDVYYNTNEEDKKKNYLTKREEFKFTIDHLGEEYLRKNFMHMYNELELCYGGVSRKSKLEERRIQLQEELDMINKQLEEE